MQKYVNQLLLDLQLATSLREKVLQAELKHEAGGVDMQEYFKEVDQYVSGTPTHNMYYHYGFSKEVFPPASKLNDSQMEAIVDALLSLWYVFRFTCNYPDEAPMAMLYPLLLQTMEEPIFLHKFGMSHFDLCGYYPPDCPFKEYCTCEEFCDEMDDCDNLDMKF